MPLYFRAKNDTTRNSKRVFSLLYRKNAIIWSYVYFAVINLAIDCGELSAALNGSVQGSDTTFPNVLWFSCDEGFELNGSTSRKCQANGTWSGVTTLCRGRILYILQHSFLATMLLNYL